MAADQLSMEPTMDFADHTQGINIPGKPNSRSSSIQQLVTQIWSFTWNPFYSKEYREEGKVSCVVEASDLDANRDRRARNQCPCCDNFFMKRDLIRLITVGSGEDSEVGGWVFRCPSKSCAAYITVLND